jgi:outer membrane protein assembly factor BamB
MRSRGPGWWIAASILASLLVGSGPGKAAGSISVAQIKVAPPIGPPTTPITVKGRGFGPTEVVDISFDGSPLDTARTSPQGRFKAVLTVPGTALPGDHLFQATGESSGSTAQGPFLVRTDWPKFHFDLANSGLNPYENVLSPDTVGGLVQAWAAPAPGFVNTGPVVAGGIAYVGVSGVGGPAWLMAVDAATGGKLWLQENLGGSPDGPPAVADGVVYLGTNSDHALHAYDALTGADVWTFTAGGGMSTAAVSGGVVYSNSSDGHLYAIRVTDGSEIWSATTGGDGVTAPAIADGVAYVGTGDSARLIAIEVSTGAVLWVTRTNGFVKSSPAVSGGLVYVGSGDHLLYAVDAATGQVEWKAPTDAAVESSPALAGGVVYVGSDGSNVYAFDAGTGVPVWITHTGGAVGLGSPSVANGVVYVGSIDHRIYALDAATGAILWTFLTGDIMFGTPAVADGSVYVGSFDQNLYAFRLP